jgi:YebC/PmpR family DNA-binding regulatory protein
MSGHSKWSQIKHKKAITDAKKGQIFTKLANAITIAAREGGDPETNFKLKTAIEKARSFNMPSENIERAIKRGTGEMQGAAINEAIYEAIGPAGTAFLIKTISDNKNRTLGEIRQILSRFGGKLAEGGVKHLFIPKGVITVETKELLPEEKETIELKIIDAGAEDFEEEEKMITIYTKPEELSQIKKNLEEQNIKTTQAEISLEPKMVMKIENEDEAKKVLALMEALDECQDVIAVYANFDISQKIMENS